jgi:hypothetical protein
MRDMMKFANDGGIEKKPRMAMMGKLTSIEILADALRFLLLYTLLPNGAINVSQRFMYIYLHVYEYVHRYVYLYLMNDDIYMYCIMYEYMYIHIYIYIYVYVYA